MVAIIIGYECAVNRLTANERVNPLSDQIFSSLIVSPIVGLVIAGGLIFLLRRYWSGTKSVTVFTAFRKIAKKGKLNTADSGRDCANRLLRAWRFHGANDGQKGIGLVMLVLVAIAPAGFVVNMNASGYEITRTRDAVTNFEHYLQQHPELPQKLIAMEPPLPAASTDGTQVTEFHCHPANTFKYYCAR